MKKIYHPKHTMPDEVGYYIYELKVTWDKGKATFVFDVIVNDLTKDRIIIECLLFRKRKLM